MRRGRRDEGVEVDQGEQRPAEERGGVSLPVCCVGGTGNASSPRTGGPYFIYLYILQHLVLGLRWNYVLRKSSEHSACRMNEEGNR